MFKLLIETVDDSPSLLNGAHATSRENAIRVFDAARRAEQQRRARGEAVYHNVVLATDDTREAPNGWESGDPECPWIVDGESF